MQNSKSNANKSYIVLQCIGIAIAVAVSIVMTLISTLLLSNEKLPIESQGTLAMLIQFMSVLAGALWVGRSRQYNKMIACGILAAIYFFILLGSAAIFLDGISNKAYTGLLSCLAGAMLGVLLNTMHRPVNKRAKRKKRIC